MKILDNSNPICDIVGLTICYYSTHLSIFMSGHCYSYTRLNIQDMHCTLLSQKALTARASPPFLIVISDWNLGSFIKGLFIERFGPLYFGLNSIKYFSSPLPHLLSTKKMQKFYIYTFQEGKQALLPSGTSPHRLC